MTRSNGRVPDAVPVTLSALLRSAVDLCLDHRLVVGSQTQVSIGLPAWCIDLLVPLLWLASGLGSRLAGWLQATVTGQAMQQRAIYGSLVAALLVTVIYARIVHISWQRIGDTCAARSLGRGLSARRLLSGRLLLGRCVCLNVLLKARAGLQASR